jgi:periplasmic divalent cation tolerance protein
MKPAARFALVLVTAPDLKTARALARSALSARLIACANLVPKIESHYRWQGRLESGTEVLLLLKTTKARLAALEKLVLSLHPYDTPEFLVLPVNAGNRKYLDWLADSCGEKCRAKAAKKTK